MLELIKLIKLANNNKLPHALLLNANQQTSLYLANNFSKWLLCNKLNKDIDINNIINNYSSINNSNINNIILNINNYINNCNCSSCKLFIAKNHPDYYVIDLGVHDEIKIENIRAANQFIVNNFYLSDTKILLINHFHNINLQAVNAFLKNLEEPNLNFKILILLITNNPKVLPSTILSRVVKINLFNIDINNVANDTNLELIVLQDLYQIWISKQLNINQLVTKWQTIDKNTLMYCLWFIIIKLIKPHSDQLLLNLSEKISPKILWLLLDSLHYLYKSIILGFSINWELFLYNFIVTKFTGENIYAEHIARR